jgi:hypothetical protein
MPVNLMKQKTGKTVFLLIIFGLLFFQQAGARQWNIVDFIRERIIKSAERTDAPENLEYEQPEPTTRQDFKLEVFVKNGTPNMIPVTTRLTYTGFKSVCALSLYLDGGLNFFITTPEGKTIQYVGYPPSRLAPACTWFPFGKSSRITYDLTSWEFGQSFQNQYKFKEGEYTLKAVYTSGFGGCMNGLCMDKEQASVRLETPEKVFYVLSADEPSNPGLSLELTVKQENVKRVPIPLTLKNNGDKPVLIEPFSLIFASTNFQLKTPESKTIEYSGLTLPPPPNSPRFYLFPGKTLSKRFELTSIQLGEKPGKEYKFFEGEYKLKAWHAGSSWSEEKKFTYKPRREETKSTKRFSNFFKRLKLW